LKSPPLDIIMSQKNVIHALWWRTKEFFKLHYVLQHFVTFYVQGLLVTGPTWELEDHPLSVIHYWLLNIFAFILHIWSLSLLDPQPEIEIILLRPLRQNRFCTAVVTSRSLHGDCTD
jgi:hypothetical protein